MGSKTADFAIKYIKQSIKMSTTMIILYPYIESILFEIIILAILITNKDVKLFEEDQIEYIYK